MFKIWANSADPNVDKSTSNSSVAKQHSLYEEDETTSQNSNFNPYIQVRSLLFYAKAQLFQFSFH